SKTKEGVELFRIDHFDLHKPLGMRLVNHCLLHLRSSDSSLETVIIYGIPGLEALADTLRECSLRERARRRVTTFLQACCTRRASRTPPTRCSPIWRVPWRPACAMSEPSPASFARWPTTAG